VLDDVVFVVGHFDPLVAAQAARVAAVRGTVVAVVTDPPNPILPLEARVVLAAGLSSVKYAVAADVDQVSQIPVDRLVDERAAHLTEREALGKHVRRRHSETA